MSVTNVGTLFALPKLILLPYIWPKSPEKYTAHTTDLHVGTHKPNVAINKPWGPSDPRVVCIFECGPELRPFASQV